MPSQIMGFSLSIFVKYFIKMHKFCKKAQICILQMIITQTKHTNTKTICFIVGAKATQGVDTDIDL